MWTIVPEVTAHRWNKGNSNRTLRFKLEGALPVRCGTYRLEGYGVRNGPGRLTGDTGKIQLEPCVPGRVKAQFRNLLINRTEFVNTIPLELEILSPFYTWKQYMCDSDQREYPAAQCDLHSPAVKGQITRFIRREDRRVLWLSGPPGSGKSFLIWHHLLRKLKETGQTALVVSPRDRTDLLAALANSEQQSDLLAKMGNDAQRSGLLAKMRNGAQRSQFRFDYRRQDIPSLLNFEFRQYNPLAMIIDEAYAKGIMLDSVMEILFAIFESDRLQAQDVLLVVTDVMPLSSRLQLLRASHLIPDDLIQPVEQAIAKRQIIDLRVSPIDPSSIYDFVYATTGNTGLTDAHAEKLWELTGGNRFLLACVLDTWPNLYGVLENGDKVPQPRILPEAGQFLFGQYCKLGLISAEEAQSFVAAQQQQQRRGRTRWHVDLEITEQIYQPWVEQGLVLSRPSASNHNEFYVPHAFREVRCIQKGT